MEPHGVKSSPLKGRLELGGRVSLEGVGTVGSCQCRSLNLKAVGRFHRFLMSIRQRPPGLRTRAISNEKMRMTAMEGRLYRVFKQEGTSKVSSGKGRASALAPTRWDKEPP